MDDDLSPIKNITTQEMEQDSRFSMSAPPEMVSIKFETKPSFDDLVEVGYEKQQYKTINDQMKFPSLNDIIN